MCDKDIDKLTTTIQQLRVAKKEEYCGNNDRSDLVDRTIGDSCTSSIEMDPKRK